MTWKQQYNHVFVALAATLAGLGLGSGGLASCRFFTMTVDVSDLYNHIDEFDPSSVHDQLLVSSNDLNMFTTQSVTFDFGLLRSNVNPKVVNLYVPEWQDH